MAKRGRPSKYTPKLATRICYRLAMGESLRRICADDDMPSFQAVHRWISSPDNKAFRDQYALARDIGLEVMADKLLDIAEGADAPLYADASGSLRVDMGRVQRDKLHVDTLKWYLSKLAPKRYGDRLDVKAEHGGAISIRWQREDEDDTEAQA